MQSRQKNIVKTVVALVALMVVILALFLNKITTPRYLSNIELKINGLVPVIPAQPLPIQNRAEKGGQWLLIYSNERQQQVLEGFIAELENSLQEKSLLVPREALGEVGNQLHYDSNSNIGIVNDDGELMGYFKPPFDPHKMLLTYSSFITHR